MDMAVENQKVPGIAVLGAGIFVRSTYIPMLKEIADSIVLKAIWSRTGESARNVAKFMRDFSPNMECKWGESGLNDIINDNSIQGVIVVLAGQIQVDVSLRMLKAGKHVLQEKPAASSVNEAESGWSIYNSMYLNAPRRPIWGVAENYRFEPAFSQARNFVKDIGEMMSVQVISEASMNSSNPYFTSSWRRNFTVFDSETLYIDTWRVRFGYGSAYSCRVEDAFRYLPADVQNMHHSASVVDCEVISVSAISRHVDKALPPPDHVSALFKLENGCAGTFIMSVSAASPKICWRVVGSEGTVETERSIKDGIHGYTVSFHPSNGPTQSYFHPFCGVSEELKSFVHDISRIMLKDESGYEPDARSSFFEGIQDVAVLEAMLESGKKQGEQVQVKRL